QLRSFHQSAGMIVEAPEALRVWLTKEMAPICDAEPAALAKYVLALLRKDKPEPELMEFCIEQLDVFLQTKARPFVEKLFAVIRDRSYLPTPPPGSTVSSMQPQSAPSGSALSRGSIENRKKDIDERKELRERDTREEEKKRSAALPEKEKEQRKGRDEKDSEKKPPSEATSIQPLKSIRKRISPPPATPRDDLRRDHVDSRFERRRSRSPRDRRPERTERGPDRRIQAPPPPRAAHRQNERYKSERTERKRSRSPYERPRREKTPEVDRKKKRCRDYDEKGYCMKGDQCIYDHGPDPVVVDDIALEKMVTNGGKAPAAPVAQIAPNFSVPPPGYTPLNPPPPGVDNVYVANSTAPPAVGLSEGYNPEAPGLSTPSIAAVTPAVQAPDFSVPPPPIPALLSNPPWHPTTYTVPSASASVLVHPPSTPYEPSQPPATVPSVPVVQQTLNVGGGGVPRRGRGGAIGGMNRFGNANVAAPNVASNRTLQVRKIPAEMNNIAKLNEHFANFGQIVNIQVCYEGDLEAALITYSTRAEAMAAYKSTAPILNNRFIKVFWHIADAQQLHTTQSSQYSHTPGITSGSAVTYNPLKGSLTKTVHIGAPSRASSSQGSLAPVPTVSSQPTSAQTMPPVPFPKTPTVPPAVTDKEKYIEVRRRRKQEKENKMRLLDLHRRKTALLTKELEQQKLIIKTLQSTSSAEKKKQLCSFFKKVDESVKALKTELEDLSSKLLAMNKANSDSSGQNGKGDEGGEVDANGVTIASKRSRSVSDASGDGYQADTGSAPKKLRHLDSTQALDNRPRVVAVRGFTADCENDLIVHMEHFGELVDMDFAAAGRGKPVTAYFTYKTRRDAEQAVALGADFPGCPITVEWATKGAADEGGVVPDEKRNPSERVTPAALLASCPLDESDEEGDNE
uniref:RRM domain-containing protein n=4 Tax=Parascaris TaxID=6254 RepID=A0A915CCT3_PARUN